MNCKYENEWCKKHVHCTTWQHYVKTWSEEALSKLPQYPIVVFADGGIAAIKSANGDDTITCIESNWIPKKEVNMKIWTDKKTGTRWYEPDCVDEYLHDIWALGVDYDGAQNEEDLKKLIDELVDMAEKARECLWKNKLFGMYGSPKSEYSD